MSQVQQRNRITSKNEKALRRRKKLRLKRIKTFGLRATGLIIGITSMAYIADAIIPPVTLKNPDEIHLETDEEYMKEILTNYNEAREAYKNNQITTPEYVEEARKFSQESLNFMKEEIKDSANARESDKVYIERNSGTQDGPSNTITVMDENGDIIQVYSDIPKEAAATFNQIVSGQNWHGTGENWTSKEGKEFMHKTDKLYESVYNLIEHDGNLSLNNPIIDNTEEKGKSM